MSTLVNNATQLGTMIDADGRRLVQFFMGTELWNNYNHVMLLDQNDIIVHKAWWTSNPMLNVSLIESEDPLENGFQQVGQHPANLSQVQHQ